MPLFNAELTRLANQIKTGTIKCYVHTQAPTHGNISRGRATAGGGAFQSGVTVPNANFAVDSDGDITVNADIDFGIATADVNAALTHWSLVRDKTTDEGIAFGTLPSTTVRNGDTFKINANSLLMNGTSS